jgi:hypothetical protein
MADSGYQGQLAGAATDGRRYGYGDTPRFQLDASPFAGGWATLGNAVTGNFGPPLYDVSTLGEACVTPGSGGADQINMTLCLDKIIRENLTDSPGVIATLQKLHLRYYRTDGASLISVSLYAAPKAGGGYPTLVDSWTQAAAFATAGPGPWTQYDDPADIGHALDVEANSYHLHLQASNTLAGDCRVGVILLDFDKTAVE